MARKRRKRVPELVVDRRDECGPFLLELLATTKALRRARERRAGSRAEDRDDEPLEEEANHVQPACVERKVEAHRRREIRGDKSGPNGREEGRPEAGQDGACGDRDREKEVGARRAKDRDRELQSRDREGEDHGEAVPHRPRPVRPEQAKREIEDPVLRRLHARDASRAMRSVTLPDRAGRRFRAGGLGCR